MKSRLVLCTLLVAVIAVVPTAAAHPQRAQASQDAADGIVSQIATAGFNAAVAKWAPDYYKDLNPTGAAIQAIQEQLAQLNAKLDDLIRHQNALGNQLSCETQRVDLGNTLDSITTWYAELRRQSEVPSASGRQTNLNQLFGARLAMDTAQVHLHNALVGRNVPNLLLACAKHLEDKQYPFLSSHLRDEVWNFWSLYRTAAAELLVVRVNMMALHPDQFSTTAAEKEARTLEGFFAEERGQIKPSFPSHLSYDRQSGWIWLTHSVPYDWYLRRTYQDNHWRVTGHSYEPTCSAVYAEFAKSGTTGWPAIEFMSRRNIVTLDPGTDKILCYDDHDRIHEFDIATGHYVYAGDFTSYAQSLVTRPNVVYGQAYVTIAHYSYTG